MEKTCVFLWHLFLYPTFAPEQWFDSEVGVKLMSLLSWNHSSVGRCVFFISRMFVAFDQSLSSSSSSSCDHVIM